MHDSDWENAGPALVRAWLDRAASLHPAKPAIVSVEDGRTVSCSEFQLLTRRVGTLLRGYGIGTNERIALVAGNSIEHVACYIGTLAYGATICTVHAEMNRGHLGSIIARLRPRLVIHDDAIGPDRVGAALDGAPHIALGRWDGPEAGTFFAAVGTVAPDEAHLAQTGPRDDAVILFTSGTTERPKGVVLSYREQVGNIEPMVAAFGLSEADRIYDFRSFNWASAQLLGVLGPLACGATLVMAKKFSASRFFDDLHRHAVTVAAGNPTTINLLLIAAESGTPAEAVRDGGAASPALPSPTACSDLPALRFITSSSAPLLIEEWRRFEQRFGVPVAQSYGSSESAWIAINPGRDRRFGTVGRPLAYHRLAIVDDAGRALPTGAVGAVEIGGFSGHEYRYLDDAGVVQVAGRARLRTGDLGFLDADGFLHLTGREKELIIRGGVNISPVEIDGVLMQCTEVAEAATVGVPDRIWGEEVVSYVVLREGHAFVPEELLRFCAAQLPAFKAPKQILRRKSLPKSERGKLDRRALVAQWPGSKA